MMTAQELTEHHGDRTVVTDLSFTGRPGTVTGFLGPNGAGKSATLRMILGLYAPTRGHATGRSHAAHPAPLTEVGALPEARSIPRATGACIDLAVIAPEVLRMLPHSVVEDAVRHLPAEALESLTTAQHGPGAAAPGAALLALTLWTSASLAAAAVTLRRRDV